MTSIISNNYLSSKPIEQAMKKFAQRFDSSQSILDIGCGKKPYQHFFRCKYIGIDPLSKVNPDIIANAWDIPLPDNHVDGVILNQSLEHIANTQQTIAEIHRVLKPNGYGIVTAPQTMKNHSAVIPNNQAPVNNFDQTKEPHWRVDYYRFTRYGLIILFKKFSIINIQETNGYFSTIFQLINYFFAALHIDPLPTPIYFLNNCLGIFFDKLFNTVGNLPLSSTKKFKEQLYNGLTINLILIIKKNG